VSVSRGEFLLDPRRTQTCPNVRSTIRCERRKSRRIPSAMREQLSKSHGARLSRSCDELAMPIGAEIGIVDRLLVRSPRQYARLPD
jgi:hypothetical protein